MEVHLKIIGSLLVVLAFIHLFFPKYFKWRDDLNKLSLINQQIMYVHTLFIALTVFLMGLLCITSSFELLNSKLGNKLSLGLFFFWLIRLLLQFFGYSSKLWKGKLFETSIHILFSILWSYFCVVFFSVYWIGKSS